MLELGFYFKVRLMLTFDLVIPAYNEALYIRLSILRIKKYLLDLNNVDWKIIVADNGSLDGTEKVVKKLILEDNILKDRLRYFKVSKKGKGRAIKEVARISEADFFGFIDADISPDPAKIVDMLNILINDQVDLVIASRLINTKTTNRSWWRTLSSRIFNFLGNLFLDLKVKDAQCGLKIMNKKVKEIIRNIYEDGWFLDLELLFKVQQKGLIVKEIPVLWVENRYENRKSHINYWKDFLGFLKAVKRIKNY